MMSPAQQLHRAAMAMASEAQAAYLAGNVENWRRLTQQAFEKEKEAAKHLQFKLDAEPTRAILFRGAAQLAYNCGEYREAERLIAEALLGNAPEALRRELRDLNRQVINALELLEPIENAPTPDYLRSLREHALHVWVQPKDVKHLTAIYVDNVVEVLRKIKESFLNFVEIDFLKNFDSIKFKEPEKLIADLRREANPLLVNLKFSSFAASISSDLVVMSKQYAPEINVWKRDVFSKYRVSVFESANYESEQSVEALASPYSPQERRRIFQPIVELFRESNNYSFALSDANFQEKKRVYKPVGKRVRGILLPESSEDDLQKQKSLFQIFGIGDADSAKTKVDVIARQVVDTANFTQTLPHIKFEKEEIFLKDPLELVIRYEKPTFQLDFPPLQISITADGYSDLVKEFQRRFVEIHAALEARNAANLSADEADAKAYLKRIVLAKGV